MREEPPPVGSELAPVTESRSEAVPPTNSTPLPRNVSTEEFTTFLLEHSALTAVQVKGIVDTILHAKKETSSRNTQGKKPMWSIVLASPAGVTCYVTTRHFDPERVGNRKPVVINFPTVEGGVRQFRKAIVEVITDVKPKAQPTAQPTGSRLSRDVRTAEQDESQIPRWMGGGE